MFARRCIVSQIYTLVLKPAKSRLYFVFDRNLIPDLLLKHEVAIFSFRKLHFFTHKLFPDCTLLWMYLQNGKNCSFTLMIFCPKVVLSMAYFVASSRHLWASPTAPAATGGRVLSNAPMAILKPTPSAPSTFWNRDVLYVINRSGQMAFLSYEIVGN